MKKLFGISLVFVLVMAQAAIAAKPQPKPMKPAMATVTIHVQEEVKYNSHVPKGFKVSIVNCWFSLTPVGPKKPKATTFYALSGDKQIAVKPGTYNICLEKAAGRKIEDNGFKKNVRLSAGKNPAIPLIVTTKPDHHW